MIYHNAQLYSVAFVCEILLKYKFSQKAKLK